MKQTTKLFALFSMFALFVMAFGCNSSSTTTTNTNTVRNSNAANTPSSAAAIEKYDKAPAGATPSNMLGSQTAAVTIEEFADFQCPSCAQVHSTMKTIQSAYGNRIKFVYRHYPLSQLHKNAYDASLAAEAAGQQNRFWDMQNQLFTSQKEWSNATDARAVFAGYAQKMGLDVPKFQSDMAALATKMRVDEDIKRGNALNLNSTPTVFVNKKTVGIQQLSADALRAIIEAELQNAGKNQTAPAATAATAPASSSAVNSGSAAANAAVSNAPAK